jgi:hypothetical protein
MDAVKISRMGTHTMVTGSDKRAVEAATAELIRAGAKPVSKVEPLGRNWIVTLETPPAISDNGGCKVVRMGLQTMVTGPSKAKVQERVQVLMQEGAVCKSGPELRDGVWIAVCDEGGVDKTIHRW